MRLTLSVGFVLFLLVGLETAALQTSEIVTVNTTAAFRAAVSAARPGTIIAVDPGSYEGGSYHANIAGTQTAPIVIRGSDPQNPPVFRGGYNGIQLSDAAFVTLQDLVFEGATQNGISIDDASTFETPSHHITFYRVTVRDLPDGNFDGIKLSGVEDFVIDSSRIERWGGSAVDMVGCHRGVIRQNLFTNSVGRGGTGVSMKGGTREIEVSDNRFEHGGVRAVQIGGTTSLTLFRPQPHGSAEATAILVERNVIVGSETAVTFVGADGGIFRFNTVYMPTWYLLRILQENRDPSMVPSQNGVVTDNIFYFRGSYGINVGSGTNPQTFTFARNWWYREDAPASSAVSLPTPESGALYGMNPQFVAPPADLRTRIAIAQGAVSR